MATLLKSRQDTMLLDREELRRRADAIFAHMGILPGPVLSAEELHARQRVAGIRPEDNAASRELYRVRYGEDWEEDWPEV